MRLVADSGLWSTGQLPAPSSADSRAGSQWCRAVVDRRRPVGRRPDHVHRSGPRGLVVARPRRDRAQRAGRGAGRTHARCGRRTHRRQRAARSRSNRCGGSPSGTGCAAGGPPASATASRPSTARSSTREIAVLTAGAQDFFTDDTFDSDVAGLLRPHAAALSAHLHGGDPRVIELVRTCAELADDVGVAFGEADGVTLRRDDYALAAGPDPGRYGAGAIATGADSVNWGAVPPGIFDAAERHRRVAHRGGRRIRESRCARGIVGPRAGVGDRGAAAVGRPRWRGCARRRRRRGVPARRRTAAARHRIGCMGS